MGYSFRLTARVLLYAPSHRQDSSYHGHCYTSRGALAGTRNNSMGPPHEGSIRRPIALWANALTTELHLAPKQNNNTVTKSLHNEICTINKWLIKSRVTELFSESILACLVAVTQIGSPSFHQWALYCSGFKPTRKDSLRVKSYM